MFKNLLMVCATLSISFVSNVFALSITNMNETEDEISVLVYYPTETITPENKESCWEPYHNNQISKVIDLNSIKYKELLVGVGSDPKRERICLLAGKYTGGKQQWTATNYIKNVDTCHITFCKVKSGGGALVLATPTCEFTCIQKIDDSCNSDDVQCPE
jgi:hypothetical protein